MTFALYVAKAGPDIYRWVLVHLDAERFLPEVQSDVAFHTYEDALLDGTQALAAADSQTGGSECVEMSMAELNRRRSQLSRGS